MKIFHSKNEGSALGWRVERGEEFVSEKMAEIPCKSLTSSTKVLIFSIVMNTTFIF